MKPVSHYRHGYYYGTSTGPKCNEQKRAIEHGKRLGKTEEDEPETDRDCSIKNQFSRTKAINEETYERSYESHLETSKAGGKRYLRIAPTKLLSDWFKKGSKPIKHDTAYIEADKKTSQYDPPSIKYFFSHRFYKVSLKPK
ncbi:MAG: hypothetical protein MUP08_01925, partial [Desulfobulbaceae bacterium]|nr:hypothetical protein [Desulfobulbaceae bacterium]